MHRRSFRFIAICFSILVAINSIACSLPAMLLQSVANPTPTALPTSTATPQPTPTNTPVPTTGNLTGQLVESQLDESNQTFTRTSLSNVLVILCVVDGDSCTIDADLTTRTDANDRFSFSDLQPGQYVFLFNPFEISDVDQYMGWLDGLDIPLSPLADMLDAVSEDGQTIYISAEPGGGVNMSIDDSGSFTLSEASAGTALWVLENPLVLEFVEGGGLVSADVEVGETTDVSVYTHFCETEQNISVTSTSNVSAEEQPTSAPAEPTSVSAQPTSAQPSDGETGLVDKFDDNQLGWDVNTYDYDGDVSRYTIRDGQYVWEYEGEPIVYDIIIPENSPVEADFFASVDVQFNHEQPDVEEATYGIVYRYQDDDHYYIFEINSSGSFDVWMVLPGDGSDFLAFEVPEASINPDGINNLAVAAQGDHFMFYINGNMVYELDDENIPSGKFGLFTDLEMDNTGNQSMIWDNFTVTAQ